MVDLWLDSDIVKQAAQQRLSQLSDSLTSDLQAALETGQQAAQSLVTRVPPLHLPEISDILGQAPSTASNALSAIPIKPPPLALPDVGAFLGADPNAPSSTAGAPSSAGGFGTGPGGPGASAPQSAPGPLPPLPHPATEDEAHLRAYARAAAAREGVSPDIYERQIDQESHFRTTGDDGRVLRSPAGAEGIAQFTPPTAAAFGLNTSDPYASLDAGAKYMAQNLAANHGDYRLALAAYNTGQGNVDKWGEGVFAPDYAHGETRDYVNAILGSTAAGAAPPQAVSAPAAPSATPPALAAPGPSVTYRDQWGNVVTTSRDQFNARPGGNSDVTVVSTSDGAPVAQAQTAGGPPWTQTDARSTISGPTPQPLADSSASGQPPVGSVPSPDLMLRQPLGMATSGPDTTQATNETDRSAPWGALPSSPPVPGQPDPEASRNETVPGLSTPQDVGPDGSFGSIKGMIDRRNYIVPNDLPADVYQDTAAPMTDAVQYRQPLGPATGGPDTFTTDNAAPMAQTIPNEDSTTQPAVPTSALPSLDAVQATYAPSFQDDQSDSGRYAPSGGGPSTNDAYGSGPVEAPAQPSWLQNAASTAVDAVQAANNAASNVVNGVTGAVTAADQALEPALNAAHLPNVAGLVRTTAGSFVNSEAGIVTVNDEMTRAQDIDNRAAQWLLARGKISPARASQTNGLANNTEWRAANPELAARYDDIQKNLTLMIGAQVGAGGEEPHGAPGEAPRPTEVNPWEPNALDRAETARQEAEIAQRPAHSGYLAEDEDPEAIVKPEDIPGVGAPTTAYGTNPNKPYDFRFRVVDAADLTASHIGTQENPAYPQELQPRDRGRVASQLQVDQIARDLNPDALLTDSGRLDSGPPIIGPDNVVESGSGRTMAIRQAASNYPERYQAYLGALRERLPAYGLTDSDLEGLAHPVLVRERVSDVSRADFAGEANNSGLLGMSPHEQATQDASRLPDSAVLNINVGDGDTLDSALRRADNRDLARTFASTIPRNDRSTLFTSTGDMNSKGYDRLANALLVKTYGGDAGERIAQAFIESADPVLRNVENAVMGSLPDMSRAEALIRAGQRPAELSLANDLAGAVDALARLRTNGMSVEEYLHPTTADMFGHPTTPAQDALIDYLNRNMRAPARLRGVFKEYARQVEGAENPSEISMFGKPPSVTRDEAWSNATGEAEKLPESTPSPDAAAPNQAASPELAGAGSAPTAAGLPAPARSVDTAGSGLSSNVSEPVGHRPQGPGEAGPGADSAGPVAAPDQSGGPQGHQGQPDLAAEVARLRAENEQLRAQQAPAPNPEPQAAPGASQTPPPPSEPPAAAAAPEPSPEGRIPGMGYYDTRSTTEGEASRVRGARADYEDNTLERVPQAEIQARAEQTLGLDPGTVEGWQKQRLAAGTEGEAERGQALGMAAYGDAHAVEQAQSRFDAVQQEVADAIKTAGGKAEAIPEDLKQRAAEAATDLADLASRFGDLSAPAYTAEGTAQARALAQRKNLVSAKGSFQLAEQGRQLAQDAANAADAAGNAAERGALDEATKRSLRNVGKQLEDSVREPAQTRAGEVEDRLAGIERQGERAARNQRAARGGTPEGEPAPARPAVESRAETLGRLKREHGYAEDAGDSAKAADLQHQIDGTLEAIRTDAAERAQKILNREKRPLTPEEARSAVDEAIGRRTVSKINADAIQRARNQAGQAGQFLSKFDQNLSAKIDRAIARDRQIEATAQVNGLAKQADQWVQRVLQEPTSAPFKQELERHLQTLEQHSTAGKAAADDLREKLVTGIQENADRFRGDLERRIADAARKRTAETQAQNLKDLYTDARTKMQQAADFPNEPAMEERFQAAAEALAQHSLNGGKRAVDLIGQLSDLRSERSLDLLTSVERRNSDAAKALMKGVQQRIEDQAAKDARMMRQQLDASRIRGVVQQIKDVLANPDGPGAMDRLRELHADLTEVSQKGFEKSSDLRQRLYKKGLLEAGMTDSSNLTDFVQALGRVDPNDPSTIRPILAAIQRPTLWGLVREMQYINMLSSPVTQLNNIAGNTQNILGRVLFNNPAEFVGSGGTSTGTGAAFQGLGKGFTHGGQLADVIMRTGVNPEAIDRAIEMGNLRGVNRELWTEALGSKFGKNGERFGAAMHAVSTRPLEAMDAMLGHMAYQSSIEQYAQREADRQLAAGSVGLKGMSREEARNYVVSHIWDYPDVLAKAGKIKDYTLLKSRDVTGNGAGATVERVLRQAASLRNLPENPTFGNYVVAGLADFIAPFFDVPLNYAKQGAERTVGGPINLVRAGNEWQQILRGVGGDREKAGELFAKGAIGAGTMATALVLARGGDLTGEGPKDPAQLKLWLEDHQRQSFRLPGTKQWISYAGTAWGIPFATVAGAMDAINDAQTAADKKDIGPLSTGIAVGTGAYKGAVQGFLSQSFMQNIQQQYQFLAGNDTGYGAIAGNAASAVSRYTPIAGSGLVNFLASVTDGMQRNAGSPTTLAEVPQNIADRLATRIPGLRETISPRLGAYGEPLSNNRSGPLGVLPYYQGPGPHEGDPITQRLESAGVGAITPPPSIPIPNPHGPSVPLTLSQDERRIYEQAGGQAFRRILEQTGAANDPTRYPPQSLMDIRTAARKEAEAAVFQAIGPAETTRRINEAAARLQAVR